MKALSLLVTIPSCHFQNFIPLNWIEHLPGVGWLREGLLMTIRFDAKDKTHKLNLVVEILQPPFQLYIIAETQGSTKER